MESVQDFFNYGNAFLVGNILFAVATFCTIFEKKCALKNVTRIAFVIASLLIVFSSVPVSNILFRFQIVMIIFLMITLNFGSRTLAPARILIRIFIAGACYYSATDYFNAQKLPELNSDNFNSIFVLGSSLGEKKESWVAMLEEKLKRKTINLTSDENTIWSTIEQAELIPDSDALIMIMTGIEDLKSEVEPKLFEDDLRTLLREISRGKRTIVMFELPTSIIQKHYLKIQREQAKLYGVKLIPRNHLFTAIDKHLKDSEKLQISQTGHSEIAQITAEMLSHQQQ